MPRPLWHYQQARSRTARDILSLRRAGIPELHPSFMRLTRVGDTLRVSFGFKIPKPMTFLFKLLGLSPGEISLWHDAEGGWFTEARTGPGASPVYRYVGDDIAVAIIKEELTHGQFKALLAPDPYMGE